MNKKQVKVIIAGLFSATVLALAYGASDSISPRNIGASFDYEKIVRSVIVILISIVIIRILIYTVVKPIEESQKKHFSGMLKYGIGISLLIAAAVFITTQVYKQSALSIFIGLGASGLGIAYIAQDFLKELFAGIVIAAQNRFRVGDWLQFPDGVCAKIVRTRLTGIDLILLNDTLLIAPNTTLTGKPIINVSQPSAEYGETVKLVLDHNAQVDRARRIIHAALINVSGVVDNKITVVAEEMRSTGALFGVYYRVSSYDAFPIVRHRVISAITASLHDHQLQVCEIIGQMNINTLEPGYTKKFDDTYVTDRISAVDRAGLFSECSDDVKREFAEKMYKRAYKEGEYVCKQGERGDTMCIVAEGVVEVIANVSVVDRDGNVKTTSNAIATLTGGDYVGEMAVLRNEERNADVIARTDVIVYVIGRETIR
ncbi:MAG: mechanosensitive ion channel family protein, partial [Holosporales bacterium]|nr:mechanosensitive ion channel family protein [Holosporales bacterium]